MGYQIVANRNQVHYGVKSFITDSIDDIKKLPHCEPGSVVYCTGTQKKYIMDTQGYWRVAANVGGGTSLGDLDGFDNVELVFDGTELSEGGSGSLSPNTVHYIWDGGTVNNASNSDYIWDGGNAAGTN